MKIYFFLLLFSLIHISYAQQLTRGQVFNFQEGDIFQTEYAIGTTNHAGPIEYRTDSIGKILFRSADSISFETQITQFFRMPNWPENEFSQPVTKSLIISLGKLSDAVFHHNIWCQKLKDTVYHSLEYCNLNISEYVAGQEEPYCHFKSVFVEGCGGPFITQVSTDTSTRVSYFSTFRLIYFYKNGDHCGELISSIKKNPGTQTVKILPNPFNDKIQLENLSEGVNIQLFNVKGEKIIHDIYQGQDIETSMLVPGEYLFILSDNNRVFSVLKACKIK